MLEGHRPRLTRTSQPCRRQRGGGEPACPKEGSSGTGQLAGQERQRETRLWRGSLAPCALRQDGGGEDQGSKQQQQCGSHSQADQDSRQLAASH